MKRMLHWLLMRYSKDYRTAWRRRANRRRYLQIVNIASEVGKWQG